MPLAGIIPFAGIIAFGTLIDYVQELNMHKTEAYEKSLLNYATQKLSLLSFAIGKADVKKLEQLLNKEYNIRVRAGQLTAAPLMKRLVVPALLGVSFCYSNTYAAIDTLVSAVKGFMRKQGDK